MPIATTATLDVCPICKTVYEVVRNHVRLPADPVCETCQRTLPVADGDDWLTYQLIRSRAYVSGSGEPGSQVAQQG
jgi:hypothetical protein